MVNGAYTADTAAFVLGASGAGFVIEAAGLRAPFAIYLGTATAAVILVITLPGARTSDGHAGGEASRLPHAARAGPGRGRAFRLLAYGTGFVFGLGTELSFLPAYAADRGFSPRAVGLLLGAYWLARLAGSLKTGQLSGRLGRRAVLLPSMLVAAGGGILGAAPGGLTLVLGTVVLGLAAGACAPTCIGLIADHVSAADRGIAMGLFEASCGVCFLCSGRVGGFSAQPLGEPPYIVVAILAIAWALVLGRRLPPANAGHTE